MRLAWNEIRHQATRFAQEWKEAHYEKGETQTFYNEFFEIFGVQRRKVAPSKNLSNAPVRKRPALSIYFGRERFLSSRKALAAT